jgi:peptidoglycan hydrolase-like protein with peptidoglycan-binding domain
VAGKVEQAHRLAMKRNSIVSLLIAIVACAMQPANAGNADRVENPTDVGYSSLGNDPVVREVQIALEKKGYNVGNTEGKFNSDTRAAVNRFERDSGLPETGSITPAVLKALGLS